ncbi:MAG: hypothetical protein KJP25_10910 [Gammaproteobacteria bacterium]|nr:hypothetical protein [Gammaproteobacteria bacterium]NND37999.1 hypothetical protein [Pseudomonadales bacterium]MBT8150230.1 hypothetical protein [Gammaproteobacteria bacterium]NNL10475.1 hypothetical protein [Pseudomonadales bacterium]NNM10567.1 hypothetical protein [Pseudomonadales bacterium]
MMRGVSGAQMHLFCEPFASRVTSKVFSRVKSSRFPLSLASKRRLHPLKIAIGLLLVLCLPACVAPPPPEPCIIQQVMPEPAPAPLPVCEPEIDLATEAALRKLSLGNEWHREGRYKAAFQAYEAVLAEHASLLADAYALWGIIAVRLDRDNPDYSRDAAQTVAYVLDQRAADAVQGEAAEEARLLWFSAKIMIEADVSKDKVIEQNRQLKKELEQRDEAIARLRELTVGS